MDILLAHAYYLYDDPHELQVMKPYPPLGILYLSSYLRARGFAVGVFDSTFSTLQAFEAQIARERPGVVGLYVNLMTKFAALRMIAIARAHGAIVVLGGPEPASYAGEYLRRGAHIVVRGEGETALERLLPHLARHGMQALDTLPGLSFMGDEGVITTPDAPFIADLSANPWPDREAIDIPAYMETWRTHHGSSSVSVIHARGCPYTCTWCSHSVYGTTHRRRTPEDAANELLWIHERYNPDRIWYADDVFAINHRWLFEYKAALEKRGLRIPFECISRADRLNEPVVAALAEMGCFRLWNGSESGSQRILDAMKRRVSADDVQARTHLLQQHGIETGMFIMLGYEGEELRDLEETVAHLRKANPDVFLTTVAYPIKGTPYYHEVEDRLLADRPWEARSDRDLLIRGRRTRRFYRFATRWMVSEVALHRARTRAPQPLIRRVKLAASATIGRAGMWLTQHQRVRPGKGLYAVRAEP
jgi:anaerobic magnesium-protoporphyrin IX monomethyl ester cyclase